MSYEELINETLNLREKETKANMGYLHWRYPATKLYSPPIETIETPEYVYYVTKSLNQSLYLWWSTGWKDVTKWDPDQPGGKRQADPPMMEPHGRIIADLRARYWWAEIAAKPPILLGGKRLVWKPPEKRQYEVTIRNCELVEFDHVLQHVPEVGGRRHLSWEPLDYETAIYYSIAVFEASLKAWESEAVLLKDTLL